MKRRIAAPLRRGCHEPVVAARSPKPRADRGRAQTERPRAPGASRRRSTQGIARAARNVSSTRPCFRAGGKVGGEGSATGVRHEARKPRAYVIRGDCSLPVLDSHHAHSGLLRRADPPNLPERTVARTSAHAGSQLLRRA